MKKIFLSQDKAALVDDQDFEWLNQWKWTYCARKHTGYAYRNVYHDSEYMKRVYMHRIILEPPLGQETDHINGDGLDNRRCNLRSCTHAQNIWNSRKQKGTTSRYKGVYWAWGKQCWMARMQAYGQNTHLGCFDSEEEAAIAYNCAARELRRGHQYLNSVPDRPRVSGRLKKRPGKTSRYVGVCWLNARQCWRAEIRVNYKHIWLGHFASEEDAARTWNAAALKYRGTKARLNALH